MKDSLTNFDVYVLARELNPSRFSKIVRIPNGYKVKLVGAPDLDRILRFNTEDGSIILELFGDGNVIITDETGKIIYALHERDWRDRSVRRGVEYVPPPAPKIFPGISRNDFANLFTAKDVVRSLAVLILPILWWFVLATKLWTFFRSWLASTSLAITFWSTFLRFLKPSIYSRRKLLPPRPNLLSRRRRVWWISGGKSAMRQSESC